MDLGLSEEQEMLKRTAREMLEAECPKTLVRDMEEDEKGYSPELWQKLVEQGFMGLPFPEKYGGAGFEFLDLMVLVEEFGRALVPGPYFYTVVVAGMAINEAGTEEQKQEYLTKISEGQAIMTLAHTEPSGRWDAGGVSVTGVADGDDFILNGVKLFVPDAHVSDYLIVTARTKESDDPNEGITAFIVDAKSAGINYEVLKTIASDKQCEVVLDNVRVPRTNVLGNVDEGWPIVEQALRRGAVGKCAEMVGNSQQVLEIAVEYAKNRVQFGRPIGSFQADSASLRQHGYRRGRVSVHHLPGRLAYERGSGVRPRGLDGQGLGKRGLPPGRRTGPPGPRWHWFHQGARHAALLPKGQAGRALLRRRRLPQGEGRRRHRAITLSRPLSLDGRGLG